MQISVKLEINTKVILSIETTSFTPIINTKYRFWKKLIYIRKQYKFNILSAEPWTDKNYFVQNSCDFKIANPDFLTPNSLIFLRI